MAKAMQTSCKGHGMHQPGPHTDAPSTGKDEGAGERMLCQEEKLASSHLSLEDLFPELLPTGFTLAGMKAPPLLAEEPARNLPSIHAPSKEFWFPPR